MRRLQIFVGVFLATFAGLAMADPASISLTSILTSAAGAAAGGIVSSLFGGSKGAGQAPAAPAIEKPTAMPSPDDAAAQEAKKKSLVAQIQRRGRASTILTGDTTSDAMG